ncbi:MAG TPA: cation-transporting P-type ATPase [Motilibacteraceae bacterium]|nr:cation-transporting P-type ATPase [Motilibacteraceae bacterium]
MPAQGAGSGDGPAEALPELPEAAVVHEPLRLTLRDLRTGPRGLTRREAARRLVAYGPNEIRRSAGARWPRELARQVLHPLALLLWAAAAFALVAGTPVLSAAIVGAVLLNAGFALPRSGTPSAPWRRSASTCRRAAPSCGTGTAPAWTPASWCPATCCCSTRATR